MNERIVPLHHISVICDERRQKKIMGGARYIHAHNSSPKVKLISLSLIKMVIDKIIQVKQTRQNLPILTSLHERKKTKPIIIILYTQTFNIFYTCACLIQLAVTAQAAWNDEEHVISSGLCPKSLTIL